MMIKRLVISSLLFFLLCGCAANYDFLDKPPERANGNRSQEELPITKSRILAKLQRFSGEFAQKTALERSTICTGLLDKEQKDLNLLDRLKLSSAIAVAPDCGNSSQAISLLEISRKITKNPSLIKYIDYQLLVLQRLHGVSRYALEMKENARESQDEAKVLQQKLEAIKSIEKSLNR